VGRGFIKFTAQSQWNQRRLRNANEIRAQAQRMGRNRHECKRTVKGKRGKGPGGGGGTKAEGVDEGNRRKN